MAASGYVDLYYCSNFEGEVISAQSSRLYREPRSEVTTMTELKPGRPHHKLISCSTSFDRQASPMLWRTARARALQNREERALLTGVFWVHQNSAIQDIFKTKEPSLQTVCKLSMDCPVSERIVHVSFIRYSIARS